MELLTYFIISALSYLGVLAGYIILLFAPEEKKPGMRYFNGLLYFTFLLSLILALFFSFNFFVLFSSLVFLALFLFFKKYQIYLSYIFFAIIFYILSNTDKFIVFAVLIFVYGLIAGAILVDLQNKKNSLFKVFYISYFVLLTNLPNFLKLFL